MRRLRTLGICLGVVLTLAALTASAASAAPEWGQCYAKEGGKYTNANCTTKGKHGSYEWRKASEVGQEQRGWETPTESDVVSDVTLQADVVTCEPGEHVRQPCAAGETETSESLTVECPNMYEHGTVASNGKGVEDWAMTFYECHAMGGLIECGNNALEHDRINTELLKGKLGYIDKEQHEVGLTVEPRNKSSNIARFTCGSVLSLGIGGASAKEGPAYPPKGGGDAIVSQLAPVDEMVGRSSESPLEHKYVLNEQLEDPLRLEGKPAHEFEAYEFDANEPTKGSKWSKGGITGNIKDTGEVAKELGDDKAEGEIRT